MINVLRTEFYYFRRNERANNINKQNDNNNWKNNKKKKPFQNQLCGVIICMNGNFVLANLEFGFGFGFSEQFSYISALFRLHSTR